MMDIEAIRKEIALVEASLPEIGNVPRDEYRTYLAKFKKGTEEQEQNIRLIKERIQKDHENLVVLYPYLAVYIYSFMTAIILFQDKIKPESIDVLKVILPLAEITFSKPGNDLSEDKLNPGVAVLHGYLEGLNFLLSTKGV